MFTIYLNAILHNLFIKKTWIYAVTPHASSWRSA
jgi:hypothetical protein